MKFVKPRKATEILGVNICTLVRWEQDSQINAIKIPSGQQYIICLGLKFSQSRYLNFILGQISKIWRGEKQGENQGEY